MRTWILYAEGAGGELVESEPLAAHSLIEACCQWRERAPWLVLSEIIAGGWQELRLAPAARVVKVMA